MTDNRSPSIYAVSTSVGSGKTRAAIEYLASPEHCTQNFIYVAPTIRLINQTADNLRTALAKSQGAAVRNLHLIHSECRHNDDVPTSVESLAAINEAVGNVGKVVIVTTATFLRILPEIANKHQWQIILDEAFSPIQFLPFHLGNKAAENWSYFREVFAVNVEDNHRIVPAIDNAAWVEEIAAGNIKRSGQKYKGLQPFAAAVANPALRCELVLTEKTRSLLDETDGPLNAGCSIGKGESDSVLLIASYVTPEYFLGFDEVIFMSALFEQTMLYHLWTKAFGINFRDHPYFSKGKLRNIHREQGKFVAIGHLLHKEDTSSKYNLERNIFTGTPGEKEPGQRVIDRIVGTASQFFSGSPFMLQLNNGYGYEPGSLLTPTDAIRIPTLSHGLNEFQDYNNVAALAVTNPLPQEAEWIMRRTGLTKHETLMAYRIHTTYQAVGRSAIRKAQSTGETKVFLTVGFTDAWMLHQTFEGSTWLGQIGDIERLADLTKKGRDGGLIIETATSIRNYLETLPPETRKVSSRAVKAEVAPICKGRTWSKAASIVSQESEGWMMEGQSFQRRDFEYYFGEPEREAA